MVVSLVDRIEERFFEHVKYFLTTIHFRSLVWVGPALLFSTATSVVILGWDGVARPLATIGTPNACEFIVFLFL